MPLRILSLPLAVVALLMAMLASQAVIAAAPPAGAELAAIVPADAALCVAIPDLKSAYGKYQTTGLGKWLSSPEMAKYRDSLKGTKAVSLTNLQGLFGFDDKLFGGFPAPAVIMALPLKDGGDIVLLIKAEAADSAVAACLKSAEDYHKGLKSVKAAVKIAGTDFCTHYKSPAVPGEAPIEHVYFYAKGYFGVSSGLGGVQQLMTNWPPAPAKSLQATPGFIAATKPLTGNSDLLWYSKPLVLLKMFEKPASQRKRGERPWSTILTKQGFGAIQGLASQVSLATANSDVEFKLFVAAPPPYTMGMQILSFVPGKKLALPAWLPAGSSEIAWFNTDPTEQFKSFGYWFDELEADGEEGTFADIMKSIATDAKGPKIDLEKELWAKLSSATLSVSDSHGTPNVAIPLGVRSLTINAIEDPKALQASLEKFFASDKEVKAEALKDGKLWFVKPGKSLFIQGEGNSLPKTNTAAIAGNYILLGDDTEWVRQMMKAPPKVAAAADPVLAPVIARVESEETPATAVRQVARFDESWEPSYEAMRGGKQDLANNQTVRMLKWILAGDTSDKFAKNFALLPAFPAVKVYLSPGGASFDSSADGILGRGFILKPGAGGGNPLKPAAR